MNTDRTLAANCKCKRGLASVVKTSRGVSSSRECRVKFALKGELEARGNLYIRSMDVQQWNTTLMEYKSESANCNELIKSQMRETGGWVSGRIGNDNPVKVSVKPPDFTLGRRGLRCFFKN